MRSPPCAATEGFDVLSMREGGGPCEDIWGIVWGAGGLKQEPRRSSGRRAWQSRGARTPPSVASLLLLSPRGLSAASGRPALLSGLGDHSQHPARSTPCLALSPRRVSHGHSLGPVDWRHSTKSWLRSSLTGRKRDEETVVTSPSARHPQRCPCSKQLPLTLASSTHAAIRFSDGDQGVQQSGLPLATCLVSCQARRQATRLDHEGLPPRHSFPGRGSQPRVPSRTGMWVPRPRGAW